jgi:hypothetical protein
VPAMGFTAFAGGPVGLRLVSTRYPRCLSLRRFAPRRQPCRLTTVTLRFLALRATHGVDRVPCARRSAFARTDAFASDRLRLRLGTSPQPTTVFPPWTPEATSRLSARGVNPSRARPLAWSSGSMRTGSAMTRGCPPATVRCLRRRLRLRAPFGLTSHLLPRLRCRRPPCRRGFASLARGPWLPVCVATLRALHLPVVAHLPVALRLQGFAPPTSPWCCRPLPTGRTRSFLGLRSPSRFTLHRRRPASATRGSLVRSVDPTSDSPGASARRR